MQLLRLFEETASPLLEMFVFLTLYEKYSPLITQFNSLNNSLDTLHFGRAIKQLCCSFILST